MVGAGRGEGGCDGRKYLAWLTALFPFQIAQPLAQHFNVFPAHSKKNIHFRIHLSHNCEAVPQG